MPPNREAMYSSRVSPLSLTGSHDYMAMAYIRLSVVVPFSPQFAPCRHAVSKLVQGWWEGEGVLGWEGHSVSACG